MKRVIDFLSDLSRNNNKPWLETNRDRYLQAQELFHSFTRELIEGIATFDTEVSGLTVKDCTFRLYRDIRFSPDKTPYKTNMGAYICPGGKKSGYAGYYFHLEAPGKGSYGNHFMSSGLYQPAPLVLKSVRDDILYDARPYMEAISLAEGFSVDPMESLKRVPRGYPADSPYESFFRMKHFLLERNMDDVYVLDKNLLKNVLSGFKKTHTFVNLLNRSVKYVISSQN